MADDRVAHIGKDKTPGPGNMCFHWLKSKTVCVLKPNHDGEHVYSLFTITENTKEK